MGRGGGGGLGNRSDSVGADQSDMDSVAVKPTLRVLKILLHRRRIGKRVTILAADSRALAPTLPLAAVKPNSTVR